MVHFFDTDIATAYGVTQAVLLQNIYFWVEKNKANGAHLHDGYFWTYNSVKAFEMQFPYLTKNKINLALQKLENEGLIKSWNFNKATYDRTKWYTVTEKGNALFQKSEMHCSKIRNALSENQKCIVQKSEMDLLKTRNGFVENQKPIPDNKPYSKHTDNKPYKEEKSKRFGPPTLEELNAYCLENNYQIDCEQFIDFYSSKDWYVGKNKMKDWKAAVRTWVRRDKKTKPKSSGNPFLDMLNKGGLDD